ncbi:hypothetical protein [Solimicrobium silvestre]|uniref:hypothetical protein n=1 Tax=Solimicrobium silvestre TaxID=2099400 RepID=UPI0013FD3FCB|nr:hypothetical protein [Solimicrobium silvestre]
MVMFILSSGALATPVTENGLRLATQIDNLHVEQHWPAGVHVNWESGEPDGRHVGTSGKHTHCSAFVASAAKSLGIYILRPPEHSPILLANAQFDWLAAGETSTQGWRLAESGIEAQALANQGNLVVAVYKNRKNDKPGHIAIVRPDTKSDAEIMQDGPQITQAGLKNFQSTSLKVGFAGHPGAFINNKVRYYAHQVSFAP